MNAHAATKAASMIQVPAERMTYEEFLRAYDGQHAEWVRGEVVLPLSKSWRHQEVLGFLLRAVGLFVDSKSLGSVSMLRYQMRLANLDVGREPDLMFISNSRSSLIREAFLDGAPDLAVEIISPETEARDRGEKFYEYEQEGVREYWLIDPARRRAEFHGLGADGKYNPIATEDGVFRSAVLPEFWLKTDWLWQEPRPGAVELLKLWGLL